MLRDCIHTLRSSVAAIALIAAHLRMMSGVGRTDVCSTNASIQSGNLLGTLAGVVAVILFKTIDVFL